MDNKLNYVVITTMNIHHERNNKRERGEVDLFDSPCLLECGTEFSAGQSSGQRVFTERHFLLRVIHVHLVGSEVMVRGGVGRLCRISLRLLTSF